MNDILTLHELVETAFNRAVDHPDLLRWKSVSIMAGCAAVRMAAEGKLFVAASLEGVADEARRQMAAMMPKRVVRA